TTRVTAGWWPPASWTWACSWRRLRTGWPTSTGQSPIWSAARWPGRSLTWPPRRGATRVTVVGVDFDNTIVCHDGLFHRGALEGTRLPPGRPPAKNAVRDYLRKRDREAVWTALQGSVYGPRMRDALPFPGVREFFLLCRRRVVPVRIISHRTRQPYQGP